MRVRETVHTAPRFPNIRSFPRHSRSLERKKKVSLAQENLVDKFRDGILRSEVTKFFSLQVFLGNEEKRFVPTIPPTAVSRVRCLSTLIMDLIYVVL